MSRKLELDGLIILILLITGFGTWMIIDYGNIILAIPLNSLGLLNGYPTFTDYGFIGTLPVDNRYEPAGWGTGVLGILLIIFCSLNIILLIKGKCEKFVPVINVIDGTIIGIVITYDISIYILSLILGVIPIYTSLFYTGLFCVGTLMILTIGRSIRRI